MSCMSWRYTDASTSARAFGGRPGWLSRELARVVSDIGVVLVEGAKPTHSIWTRRRENTRVCKGSRRSMDCLLKQLGQLEVRR